jgi:hypothetical protein
MKIALDPCGDTNLHRAGCATAIEAAAQASKVVHGTLTKVEGKQQTRQATDKASNRQGKQQTRQATDIASWLLDRQTGS